MPPKSQPLNEVAANDPPAAAGLPVSSAGKGPSFGAAAMNFESLDLDGDGVLTREEFQKAMQMQAEAVAADNSAPAPDPGAGHAPTQSAAPTGEPAQAAPKAASPLDAKAEAVVSAAAPEPNPASTSSPSAAAAAGAAGVTAATAAAAKPLEAAAAAASAAGSDQGPASAKAESFSAPSMKDGAVRALAPPTSSSTEATMATGPNTAAVAAAAAAAAGATATATATSAAAPRTLPPPSSSPQAASFPSSSSSSFAATSPSFSKTKKTAEIELPTVSPSPSSQVGPSSSGRGNRASTMAGMESYGESCSSSSSASRGGLGAQQSQSIREVRTASRSESETLLPRADAAEESSATRVQRLRNMAFGGVGTAICATGIFALQLWVAWNRYDCRLPDQIENVSPEGPCLSPEDDLLYKDGSIPGGAVCRPMCAEGYEATPSTPLRCLKGVLSPPSFRCEPKPCIAPKNIAHADPSGVCEEGDRIPSGANCTTQCEGSYMRKVETLICDKGNFSPDPIFFRCTKLPCHLPNQTDIPNSAPGLCKVSQSDKTASVQTCTPLCEEGYQSTVEELVCNEETETIEPATFECIPASCSLPTGIEHSIEPSETTISHGERYTPSCGDGFMVKDQLQLRCDHGRLNPRTFQCTKDKCEAPAEVQHVAEDGPCQDTHSRRYVSGGKTCEARCEPGFVPTVASLLCHKGILDPPSFTCERADLACSLPRRINHVHPKGGCLSGRGYANVVVSGKVCEATCQAGFDPSPRILACKDGHFEEGDSFQCLPRSCHPEVLKVPHANAQSPCERLAPDDDEVDEEDEDSGNDATDDFNTPRGATSGFEEEKSSEESEEQSDGNSIRNGHKCRPQCEENYTPSEEYLNCSQGAFSPPTFQCQWLTCAIDTEALKGIAHVSEEGPCANSLDGKPIEPAGSCQAKCQEDFVAEPAELTCKGGQLEPPMFVCLSSPCKVPYHIQHSSGEACRGVKEGTLLVNDGVDCIPQCQDGYLPSLDIMTCKSGKWDQPMFTCSPMACEVAHLGPFCTEGEIIQSGDLCTPTCPTGLEPSIPGQTRCVAGKFDPEVECQPPSCSLKPLADVPHVSPKGLCRDAEDGTMLSDKLVSNRRCFPQCQEGFGPSVFMMLCAAGHLNPPTFECFVSCNEPSQGSCEEGAIIPHGSLCTPICKEGEIADAKQLRCNSGQLDPPDFTCRKAKHCRGLDATLVSNADSSGRASPRSCFADWQRHSDFCKTKCQSGYVPSVDWLQCIDGTIVGADQFECRINKCLLPYIPEGEYVGDGCYANGWIFDGNYCELRCDKTGLRQLVLCKRGQLTPPNIACLPYFGPFLPDTTTTVVAHHDAAGDTEEESSAGSNTDDNKETHEIEKDGHSQEGSSAGSSVDDKKDPDKAGEEEEGEKDEDHQEESGSANDETEKVDHSQGEGNSAGSSADDKANADSSEEDGHHQEEGGSADDEKGTHETKSDDHSQEEGNAATTNTDEKTDTNTNIPEEDDRSQDEGASADEKKDKPDDSQEKGDSAGSSTDGKPDVGTTEDDDHNQGEGASAGSNIDDKKDHDHSEEEGSSGESSVDDRKDIKKDDKAPKEEEEEEEEEEDEPTTGNTLHEDASSRMPAGEGSGEGGKKN